MADNVENAVNNVVSKVIYIVLCIVIMWFSFIHSDAVLLIYISNILYGRLFVFTSYLVNCDLVCLSSVMVLFLVLTQ